MSSLLTPLITLRSPHTSLFHSVISSLPLPSSLSASRCLRSLFILVFDSRMPVCCVVTQEPLAHILLMCVSLCLYVNLQPSPMFPPSHSSLTCHLSLCHVDTLRVHLDLCLVHFLSLVYHCVCVPRYRCPSSSNRPDHCAPTQHSPIHSLLLVVHRCTTPRIS
jgi:hypothetical protein